ncbi:MAG: hypothetical protein GXP51_04645 [Deltaproteobacteria bacterium]|nr:hypothetical protein [Deltaproteobacteria bacterium]
MRTKTVLMLLSIAALVLFAGSAFAITGACVNCHTMHNSQNGSSMAYNGSTTPNGVLLRAASCGGCHADATVNGSNSTMDGTTLATIPQVDASINYLAGGSFNWVESGTADNRGHNVADLGIAKDATLTADPPGFDSANTPVGTEWATNQLTCAGVYGCHGDHGQSGEFAAVKGAHHSNVGGNLTTADTVGNSYRFLKGIKGGEDADWEATTSDTDHNVYYGAARTTTNNDPTDTISSLCAQCHGKFHTASDIVSVANVMSSPWVRHPTDIDMRALPGTSEYAAYVYSVQAPAALSTLPATLSASSYSSEAIVTCVSCHRAHGSENADLLRWDYTGMTAGTTGAAAGTGCFRCHTTKDGV